MRPHGYKEYRDLDSPVVKEDRDFKAPRISDFKGPRALRSYADLDTDQAGAKEGEKSGESSGTTESDKSGLGAKEVKSEESSEEGEVVDIGDLY